DRSLRLPATVPPFRDAAGAYGRPIMDRIGSGEKGKGARPRPAKRDEGRTCYAFLRAREHPEFPEASRHARRHAGALPGGARSDHRRDRAPAHRPGVSRSPAPELGSRVVSSRLHRRGADLRKLSDLYGRKPFILSAIVLFLVGSVL